MFSVTRSAQADVSAVAMMRMIRDLHLDQWTTAPWWWPATAGTVNRVMLQPHREAARQPGYFLVPHVFGFCCALLQEHALSFADMNVIDMGVRLQGERQSDDVSEWQEGRHSVHQRPDKSDDTAAEREEPRVKLESLESSGNVTCFDFTGSILFIHILPFHQ